MILDTMATAGSSTTTVSLHRHIYLIEYIWYIIIEANK